MRLLLDTHMLIWAAQGSGELRSAERAVLADTGVQLLVSVISFWELRVKWSVYRPDGSRKGAISPQDAAEFVGLSGWDIAPLTAEDCLERLKPPLNHRDPHDEMLLVHAQRLGAKLFTRDRQLAGHPLVYPL